MPQTRCLLKGKRKTHICYVQSSQKTFFFFQKKKNKQLNPKPKHSRVVCLFPRDQSYCDGHLRQTRETDGNDARQQQQQTEPQNPPSLSPPRRMGYLSFKYIFSFSLSIVFLFFFFCSSSVCCPGMKAVPLAL
jgi:hypothetical protein